MGDSNHHQHNGEVGTEHVSIDIITNLNKELANSIKSKLDNSIPLSSITQCSIYRVHEKIRRINEFAYTPETISIGPYHHGEVNLAAMEDHKLRYVHALLSRTTTTETKLEKCIESIREIEDEIRKCYSEPINLNSNEFVQMMLIDGLFIIELFRKNSGEVKVERGDPIFGNIWGLSSLVRDLILLENQIPMIVLKCLFNLPELKEDLKPNSSITVLSLLFFNQLMPRDKKVIEKKFANYEGKHLLDLFGKTFHCLPSKSIKVKKNTWKLIPSVTELKRAGVKFVKSNSISSSFLDIKFDNGVMEIPSVIIQDQTDSLLRNLIASEQCCDGNVTYMTSYAFFMDSLIDSGEDVRILRNQGIITNYLGDDEDVAGIFNKLCCEVTLAGFYYSELCDKVNTYYETRWHVYRTTLKRDYFNNPWAIISFVGGIILLILTFTATLFAILSFAIHKS